MFTRYIQRLGDGYRETVDELTINCRADLKELRRLVSEYRLSDPTAHYYTSQRACNDWK